MRSTPYLPYSIPSRYLGPLQLKLPLKGVIFGILAGMGQGIGLVLSKVGMEYYEASIAAQGIADMSSYMAPDAPIPVSLGFMVKKLIIFLLATISVIAVFAGSVAADTRDGWVHTGDCWYYYQDGTMVCDEFMTIGGYRFYFDEYGVMKTGYFYNYDDQESYFFDENGHMVTGWMRTGDVWVYFDENGHMYDDGEYLINGEWYYFSIAMQTNRFIRSSDGLSWYYYDENGHRSKGWKYIGKSWYFFGED